MADLQASVPTIEHHERPEYLDRLAMLRDQVFTLDHMFMSLFSTLGWMFRLVITAGLLASVHPGLVLLLLCTLPAFWVSTWRPAVENRVEEAAIGNTRLARHLFTLGASAPPAEVRVTATAQWLVNARRSAWEASYRPVSRTADRLGSLALRSLGGVRRRLRRHHRVRGRSRGAGPRPAMSPSCWRPGSAWPATSATRLASWDSCRGFWLDASRRLTWLESGTQRGHGGRAGAGPPGVRHPAGPRLVPLPRHGPAGPGRRDPPAPCRIGGGGSGRERGRQVHAGQAARWDAPTSGRILVDDVDLAGMNVVAWRQRLAGAFQDFFRFEFHAQRAVGVGDLPRLDQVPRRGRRWMGPARVT